MLEMHKCLGSCLQPEGRAAIEAVLENLQGATWFAEKAEATLAEILPPNRQKPHYAKSKWESLLEAVDHSLERVRPKEIEHRLWKQLDTSLRQHLKIKVNAMTRFTIVSILLEACHSRWVEPSAIKQHFYEQKRRHRK